MNKILNERGTDEENEEREVFLSLIIYTKFVEIAVDFMVMSNEPI